MRWMAAALVLLLAGCSGSPETSDHVTDVVDPKDYSYLENDTSAHRHDYWRGQERITILDEERESGGLISSCGGYSWEMFRPEEAVIQGARNVEVTLTWQDAPGDHYAHPELWIKTAADSAERLVADVRSGETVVFESNNTANDLPHSLLSAWEFHWYLSEGSDADPMCHRWFTGTLSIQVDIVKGLEIPLYPGHPDRWDNQTESPVLAAKSTSFYYRGPPAPGGGTCLAPRASDRCMWGPHVPDNGTVIPIDASEVEVVLTVDAPDPFDIRFAYHGADTRELTHPQPDEEGSTRTYWIPVEGAMGDGPYAKQSLWEFWVYPEQTTQHFHGAYEIAVTVRK